MIRELGSIIASAAMLVVAIMAWVIIRLSQFLFSGDFREPSKRNSIRDIS